MKIGVCGMGKMGAAMAARLIDVGHEVTVWNRDMAKTTPLVATGAKAAASPEELAKACEMVITMLLNAEALETVYAGPQGILAADLAGKIVMDMSTIMPETAEKTGQSVAAKGGSFVECPVGGTVGPAREGKLLGLVGGAADHVERARPVLAQLCRRIEHVGPVGSGARMKLAVNLPLMVYWQALGEALVLAKPLNLPADRLIDILSDTSGTPVAMKGRGPAIATLLKGESIGAPAFSITAARKDLGQMHDLGRRNGVAMPVTAATLASFSEAESAGLGSEDPVLIPVRWSKQAN
jgi:3-hydroxyisobutyrate dehydrogenase